MANTGVLPFVRGVDFSNNDFKVSTFSYDSWNNFLFRELVIGIPRYLAYYDFIIGSE